ncbi:MAG TPA: mannose-1-phosphate guanylyltransferase/mannose-6-phosphate isomerase [Acidocella sp.]|nr:MAG: mannose-1-phosphate guanylyltransferase/mannose-6-phosphate isomerase [Acidocella sp. 20-61-6]HQT47443.1 mannose-1-phosphate guanylyltransferase/mannose-6-phosphate isomerase [Acidocella sp.]
MSLAEPGDKIIPVILSGGSGTRLWPVSRKSFPKQFWPLISEQSMLAETALRAVGAGFSAPIVVTNQDHRFVVAEQLRNAGINGARILLEPVGRNSAPAIAAAALLAAESNPDAVLWIMAADASISDLKALEAAVQSAAAAAQAGYFVTFGMQPTAPETGYGYIAQGESMPGLPGVFKLTRFIEKPDAATAETLIAEAGNLWNSGMFMFQAGVLLSEMERLAPDVLNAVRAATQARGTDLDFIRLGTEAFSAAPDISIDYAIAEKTDKAVVVPAAIGWSDVGSWAALAEIAGQDAQGNSAQGEVVLENVQNSYARSDGIVTALLGVRDLVVVTTQDAVLVAHKDEAQNVKKIVDRLKLLKRPEADTHNRTYRPWGFYESLIHGDRFQVKRIVVWPGQKLSLQKHFHRAEHWVVVAGCASVTRDAEIRLVHENESIYLPLGCVHRMENPGKIPLTLIEVQSGPYLGEDDIVRFEDTYGRS